MRKLPLLVLFVCTILAACRNNDDQYYSIRDFDARWRVYLITILNQGYVNYDTAYRFLKTHLADDELKKLRQAEHPIWRAVAYDIMLNRPSFDHFSLIMDNLEDTAIVAFDWGEWGVGFCTVSDYLVENGRWKDTVAKNKTIGKLVLQHNKLRSAYRWVDKLPPVDAYYDAIREMASRPFGAEDGIGQPALNMQENAWLALARYRKKEDVELITSRFESHQGLVSEKSFRLMEAFPDQAYFPFLQQYQERWWKRSFCRGENYDLPPAFIRAVAANKTEASRDLLNAILNTQLTRRCQGTSEELQQFVYDAIWDHPCPAYEELRKQAAAYHADRPERYAPRLSDEPVYTMPETARPSDPEPVRWWY